MTKTAKTPAPFDFDAFERATCYMSAYALSHAETGAAVGRIVIKPPKDGAGTLYAYVQIWGGDMVRGSAKGYGYDKQGRALSDALKKLSAGEIRHRLEDELQAVEALREIGSSHEHYDQIRWAIADAGYHLHRAI